MSNFAEDYRTAILSQNVNTYKKFNFKYHGRAGFFMPKDEEIEILLRFGMLHEGNAEQKQKAVEWLYENDYLGVLKWI